MKHRYRPSMKRAHSIRHPDGDGTCYLFPSQRRPGGWVQMQELAARTAANFRPVQVEDEMQGQILTGSPDRQGVKCLP